MADVSVIGAGSWGIALAYYMHGANIARLILHEERKTYLFKKNKEA